MNAKPPHQRVADCIARHPDWPDHRVAKAAGVLVQAVRAVRAVPASPDGEPAAAAKPLNGVTLDGRNVFLQRPQDRAKGLIYGVPRGRGFPVKGLSAQWGLSEETIIAHAKRFDAFRYVEVEPGKYLPCVLHPETARQYGG